MNDPTQWGSGNGNKATAPTTTIEARIDKLEDAVIDLLETQQSITKPIVKALNDIITAVENHINDYHHQ